MALDRFHRILRAGGDETAGVRQHGRNQSLVQPQSELHCLFHLASSFRHSRALCGQPQASRYLGCKLRERQRQHSLARIEHDIHRPFTRCNGESYGFAHSPLDAIAFYGSPQHLAHGKADTRPGDRLLSTPQEKHRHVSRELPASVLIHALKIGVLQQMLRFRKPAAGGGVVTRHSVSVAHLPQRAQSCGMVGHDPLQFHRKAEFLVVGLVAITRRYGDALASLGTTARQHRPTALGLHARTKSVRLRAVTTVGLECALRHAKTALLTG
jgi:hypothetical protein